jgi:flagellar protein FlbD
MEPMIVVTRLNRTRFAVNPDLVERIQAAPDTTITMVDGATFIVTESMDEVIEQITHFRARVLATAAAWPQPPVPEGHG